MKDKIIKILIILIIAVIVFIICSKYKLNVADDLQAIVPTISNKEKVENHYSTNVITNEVASVYNENLENVGKINKNVHLELLDMEITEDTEYFQFIYNNKTYNIKYKFVDVTDKVIEENTRYNNYVPFDETLITKANYEIFKDGKSVLKMGDSKLELPIYIKEENSYGVLIDNKLYYINKADVESTKYSYSAKELKAERVPTIVYHFVYDPKEKTCNQEICHTIDQVQSHLDILKENDYFTLTMDEFEMFLDGKINVQKNSVLITLDDGLYALNASKIFTENKMNISMFIVSGWYDPKKFVTPYVEVHSHSNNLHKTGDCPTGQGGGIQCLSEDVLLKDLKTSRSKTYNTTAFCYPFYEFNEYSISVLKKAGFTMGFGGLYEGGIYMAYPGSNKFRIPRITMLNSTTAQELIEAIR